DRQHRRKIGGGDRGGDPPRTKASSPHGGHVNAWLLLGASVLGLFAGALANFCAESWSRSAPRISPWRRRNANDPRQVIDFVPVVGWWARRKAVQRIAPGCWRRAAFVELGTAALYFYLAWGPSQRAFLTLLILWGA